MTEKYAKKPDERRDRLEKLGQIQKSGINPYPAQGQRTHTIHEVLVDFDNFSEKKTTLTLAGRLRAKRTHGGASFADLQDATDKIQIFLRKNDVGEEQYKFFTELVDLGDFLQLTGTLFTTKMGEKSLKVENFALLAKTIRPLPEKWHGLSDIEIRFRQRYLDMLANPEVLGVLKKRAVIVQGIREFLEQHGFIEIETPILQPIPGGATAKPFITHHNALDSDFYLRIAPELYLKKLVVGGFEKVYEIARCFRNEGIDYAHNPEFTQVEFYQAYADYYELMGFTEKMIAYVANKVNGSYETEYDGHKINFTPPYPRVTFKQALINQAGIDLDAYPDQKSLYKVAKAKGIKIDKKFGYGKIADELYKEFVRKNIIQPTFIIDHPVELSPLSKKKIDNPKYVERFQLVLGGGIELCNAFSELNDPIDQSERFKEQEKLKKAGDEEAQYFDKDFVAALEHGLPPTAGEGIGIDRLTQVLTNSHNIKEVIAFPTLRPER